MSMSSQLLEPLQEALERPGRGIVGIVDDLIRLCPEQGLSLGWDSGRCRIQPLAGDAQELLEFPLRKSVFRSLLARIAALCNEQRPDSVSAYGGQGELLTRSVPQAVVKVTFTNTADEQTLVLAPR